MLEMEIKVLLVKYFLESFEDFTVGSEFSFQFGERRADLVLLESGYLTAFEIKGARDTLNRLSYQMESYKRVFDYCFLVCEPSNLTAVRLAAPDGVGILLVSDKGITHVRKSRQFKKHDKIILSSILSVQKLSQLTKKNNLRSKYELCSYVSKNNSLDLIRRLSRDSFEERYSVASRLMKQETTMHLNSDDIYTITRRPPSFLKRR